jgi:biopolymer transport protein ExbD
MGMNIGSGGSGDPDVMIEMNMTPLIDVMLVLIIMLIITIPVQNHSVNLNLPISDAPPPPTPPIVHEVYIDFDGTDYWDGAVIDSASLSAKLHEVGAKQPREEQDEVHVKPNKLAHYKYVAAVMAAAQRQDVMKIGMVGNEQFQ